ISLISKSLQKELETCKMNKILILLHMFAPCADDDTWAFCRQLMQNKKSDELLEEYTCEIQELKLKQRKQRMKFENQLHQLMEQHKDLHSMFTPDSLPGEIRSAENTNSQLLSAEQVKLGQLQCLSEELEEVKKQQQPGVKAADSQEEADACL
uniref:Synaptonemal complex central element protein 1 n=1 Tax=Mola mola TaxID=94237 RepID=A0A3Q3XG91_MOLML